MATGKTTFDIGGVKVRAKDQESANKLAGEILSERKQSTVNGGLPGVPIRNEQQNNPFGYYGEQNNPFPETEGNPNAPTVFSNANIIESKIPQLSIQANALPTYGAPSSEEGGSGSSTGDINFDELLGFSDGKKKKKKQDGFRDLEAYEGNPNYNLPNNYYETKYGDQGQVMKTLAEMQNTSDRYTRDSISTIQSKFGQRARAQEESNARNLANVRQALNLGGSSRYAPLSATGIISAQESAGIKALTEIDDLERQAVAEAKQAQQSNDYKLLEQKLKVVDSLRQDKASAMIQLQEAQVQTEKDNQIADLVAQGITDPIEMLQTLNEQGGGFTLNEITGALKGLQSVASSAPGAAFKFDTKQIGPLLGAGFSAIDIQDMQYDLNNGVGIEEILTQIPTEQHAAVMQALGVDGAQRGVVPGVGAPDELTEQAIRTRLFPKAAAILNKGTLSDADRKIIDERIDYFRNNGMSEQQILDVFSGWSADVNSPYNDSFRDILITNDKDGQGVSPALSRVGSLLANGNYKGAMRAVEQTAMLKAKELDPEGYMGDAPTEVYTKRIDRIKKLLSENSDYGDTGFIEGNFNKVLGKLKGQRAQEIRSELRQLYQQFRVQNSGTAVTESESKYLNDLFADLDDPKGNFVTKLDVFQNGILDRYNATRGSVSLPPVRVLDVLDPAERLGLYGNSTASALESNSLGI